MSDRALLEAERRWRASPDDDHAVEALLGLYDRLDRLAPAALLRRSQRWKPLAACIARWYARPLGDQDGVAHDALLAAEERLGLRLTTVLREWYLLVGERLEAVQDQPVPDRGA